MIRTHSIYLFLLLTLASLLSACMGGSAPIPADHYYRLPQARVAIAKQQQTRLPYAAIGIPPTIAHGLYLERSILFVDASAPLELQQYHYHHWHDAPARIIQEHLIHRLQQQTTGTDIVRLNSGEQTDVMLTTRLVRFERELTDNGITVLIELEVTLKKNYRALHKNNYRQTLAVKGDTMHDTVLAFAQALTAIYTAVLNDISH